MNRSEKQELEHYRAQRKKEFDYRNKYSKENYRRMICMYPIAQSEAIDQAMEQAKAKSVSAYLSMLVERDLKERGLIE